MPEHQSVKKWRLNAKAAPKTASNQAEPETVSPAAAGVLQMQRMLGNQAVLQLMRLNASAVPDREKAAPPAGSNTTGLPDNLKQGVEQLSGMSMDDVRVHYNSDRPARVGASAYTQGTDIHVAPGQERHLPHETWHVVQQARGRVRATMQIRGADVNDDAGLEKEADEVGSYAVRKNFPTTQINVPIRQIGSQGGGKAVIQRASVTIGDRRYTRQSEVDDIVKTVEGYQEDRDLYLAQVFFNQDRVFKTQADLFAEIVKQRPSFMLTEKYWKDKAVGDRLEDGGNAYRQSQLNGFWGNYTGSRGTARDVSAIISETGKKLLDEIESAGSRTDEQLRLYRGMKKEEGLAIIRWFYGQKAETEKQMKGGALKPEDLTNPKPTDRVGIMPVKHHLGGFEQAQNYGQGEDEVVMEFTLKKGAHNVMFKPEYMALAPAGKGAISAMAAHAQYQGKPLPTGSRNEGELAGRIGIKSEAQGPFSFSLGDSKASQLLFQLLIEQVKVVKGSLAD